MLISALWSGASQLQEGIRVVISKRCNSTPSPLNDVKDGLKRIALFFKPSPDDTSKGCLQTAQGPNV